MNSVVRGSIFARDTSTRIYLRLKVERSKNPEEIGFEGGEIRVYGLNAGRAMDLSFLKKHDDHWTNADIMSSSGHDLWSSSHQQRLVPEPVYELGFHPQGCNSCDASKQHGFCCSSRLLTFVVGSPTHRARRAE